MKSIFTSLNLATTALIALLAMSCNDSASNQVEPSAPNEERPNLSGDLVLTASSGRVSIGEEISFEAYFGDTDITDEDGVEIYYQTAPTATDEEPTYQMIDGLNYTLLEARDYEFYVAFEYESKTYQSENITIEVTVPEGDLRLVATPTAAKISEEISFSIMVGDTDMSDNPAFEIRQDIAGNDDITIEGNNFTPKEYGAYNFYVYSAISGVWSKSQTTTIYCAPLGEEGVNDYDSNTPQFEMFKRRTLAFQLTGTWCGWCPRMICVMHNFMESDRADDILFAVCHSGDIMTNDDAETLIANFFAPLGDSAGYPYMCAGSLDGNNVTPISSLGNLNSLANEIAAEDAKSAIGATTKCNGSSITVNAHIKVAKSSKLGVGAIVIENGIYTPQLSNISDAALGGVDIDNHLNVLHAISTNRAPFYESLGGKSNHTAKEIYKFNYSFDTSAIESLEKVENCQVLVYTYDIATARIDNVVTLPVNGTKMIDYTKYIN